MEHLRAVPIGEFMIRDLITLHLDDTLADAYQKMHDHLIRHLPVVNDAGEILGLFSQFDLQKAYAPRETEEGWYYDKGELELLSLKHFMTSEVLTMTPQNSLKEAAETMARTKYGCIPIVEPGTKKLVGIISYVDVLHKIASIL